MVQPKLFINSNQKKDHLPPLTPEDRSSTSTELSLNREITPAQTHSLIESSVQDSIGKTITEEDKPKHDFDFEAQNQNSIIQPFDQTEARAPLKKEEKIMVSTSETDALYN